MSIQETARVSLQNLSNFLLMYIFFRLLSSSFHAISFQTLDRVSTTLACDSAIWGLAFRSYSYTPFFSSGNISDSSLSSLFHVFSPFFSISFHFFPLILKSESSDCSFCFVGLFVTCFRLVCDQFDWELSHH